MGASYASETWGVPLGETWGEKRDTGSATWGDMGSDASKSIIMIVPFDY